MKTLDGKVALITGAGSGIGAAMAKLFAHEGAKIGVADIDADNGRMVADEIQSSGGESIFIHADVAKSVDIKAMIDQTLQTFGRIDILCNNAGILGQPLEGLTEERWRMEIDIMLTGPFIASQYVIPIMRKQGGGNIINTGSIGSLIAGGSSPAYTAAKGGLLMLTKFLGKSLAKEKIRVNCICPGPVDTGFTAQLWGSPETEEAQQAINQKRFARVPMGRAAQPEEVAAAALFLASENAAFITGIALPVDGGILA